jgi:iron complex outermembrane receptor protein
MFHGYRKALIPLFLALAMPALAQDDLDLILAPEPSSEKSAETPPEAQQPGGEPKKESESAAPSAVSSDQVAPAPAAVTDAAPEETKPSEDKANVAATQGKEAPSKVSGESGFRSGDSRNRLIEEIIVTAQKREENLQDVPISVQAFSSDALDARGIEEPKALQLVTPGMQYDNFGGFSLIYLRGIGTEAFIPSADQSVATYIDGVYYPVFQGLATALGSVERIEVLKGPQGTLFGRNTTGGAINVVTKSPGPEPETSVLVTLESYDKKNIRAYSNFPVSEGFAVSVSGLSYSEESYYKLSPQSPRNTQTDDTVKAFSAKLGMTAIEDLDATLGYTYIRTAGQTVTSLIAGHVSPLGQALGVTSAPGEYQDHQDAPHFLDASARVATADLKYSTDRVDLRFIGSDQSTETYAQADYDGSDRPLVTFSPNPSFQTTTTYELQLLSNENSWGADWLKYIGGLYYIDSTGGWDPILFTVGPNVLSFLANPRPDGPLSVLSPLASPLMSLLESIPGVSDPLRIIDSGLQLSLQGVLDTQSTAAFFQTTMDFTDWFALTLGGRYQQEVRKLVKSTTSYVPDPGNPSNTVPMFDFGTPETKTSNFSPKAVLQFKLRDEDLLYLSYAKGYKSGTYNIVAIYTAPQYVEPEVVTAYEVGYKTTLFDGAMRLNSAIFQSNLDNLQVQTISVTSGGAVRFENAGSTRIRGAEFDMLWQVLPESLPGLVLTAGGAYLNGVYISYLNGSGFDETTGIFFGGSGLVAGGGVLPGRDFSGNTTSRTPELSGNLGLSYSFDIASGTVEVAGDVYYNSGSYYNAQNTQTAEQKEYAVVNARASYFYQPWGLRVTVFGKNINDARYYNNLTDLDFGTASVLSPPVTYGLRLNWDF